jgi:hypothetical protein
MSNSTDAHDPSGPAGHLPIAIAMGRNLYSWNQVVKSVSGARSVIRLLGTTSGSA